MKSEELRDGSLLRLSPRSITVKDGAGKTRGVISARELHPRESSEIWGEVRKAVGLNATSCIRAMRWIDGKPVYFSNSRTNDANVEKLRKAGFQVIRYIPA